MLTANYDYIRSNRENLPLQIHIKLSKKQSIFFCNFLLIFGINIKFPMFRKKISLRALLFLKLLTAKDVLI